VILKWRVCIQLPLALGAEKSEEKYFLWVLLEPLGMIFSLILMVSNGSTVIEELTCDSKVEGSDPAATVSGRRIE
jgi:hypothetical protein